MAQPVPEPEPREPEPPRYLPEVDEMLNSEEPLSDKELAKLVVACSYSWFMWNLMYTTVVPMLPFYAAYYGLTALHQGIILASLQIGFLLGVTLMNVTAFPPIWLVHIGAVCYVV